MDPTLLHRYLQTLCDDLDVGRTLDRSRLLAVTMGLLAGACLHQPAPTTVSDEGIVQGTGPDSPAATPIAPSQVIPEVTEPATPTPPVTVPEQPPALPAPPPDIQIGPVMALYGLPAPRFLEVCDDGLDNDGNGLVDCDDPRCRKLDACDDRGAVELYAAP